jgi:hypothetical protein
VVFCFFLFIFIFLLSPPGVCLGCLGPPWGLFYFFGSPWGCFYFVGSPPLGLFLGFLGPVFTFWVFWWYNFCMVDLSKIDVNLSVDDSSYYSRVGLDKVGVVLNFVRSLGGVSSVLDVGCNNGLVSHALGVELGIPVRGIDLSNSVSLPAGYDFVRDNIVTRGVVDVSDVTLFLSLYHHILSLYGLDVADRLFFRLLSRCEVLLFDCGNLSEVRHSSFGWFKFQRGLFNSERELLEHFGLPFEVVGSWRTGGGVRTVVAFRRSDLIASLRVVDTFKRLNSKSKEKPVLFRVGDEVKFGRNVVFEDALFYRLRWNNFDFFGKFRKNSALLKSEFDNLRSVYEELDGNSLIPFYGWLGEFGLVFDWVESLNFSRKPVRLELSSGLILKDVEVWSVNGVEKFIDFER